MVKFQEIGRHLTKPSNRRLFRRLVCGLTLRYHKPNNSKAAIYGGVKVFMIVRIFLAFINAFSVILIFVAGYFALTHIQLSGKVVDGKAIDTSDLMDVVILVVSIGFWVGVIGAALAAAKWKRLHVIEKGVTVSILPLLFIIFLGASSV